MKNRRQIVERAVGGARRKHVDYESMGYIAIVIITLIIASILEGTVL